MLNGKHCRVRELAHTARKVIKMPTKAISGLSFEHLECIIGIWDIGHSGQDMLQTQPINVVNGKFGHGDHKYRIDDACIKDLMEWGYLEFTYDNAISITNGANDIGLETFSKEYLRKKTT